MYYVLDTRKYFIPGNLCEKSADGLAEITILETFGQEFQNDGEKKYKTAHVCLIWRKLKYLALQKKMRTQRVWSLARKRRDISIHDTLCICNCFRPLVLMRVLQPFLIYLWSRCFKTSGEGCVERGGNILLHSIQNTYRSLHTFKFTFWLQQQKNVIAQPKNWDLKMQFRF